MKNSFKRIEVIRKREAGKLLLFVFLMFSSFISAKDVYVDAARGDDANTGDFQNPFQSLQKATIAMTSGDVCYIRTGVYRETLIPQTDHLTFRNYKDEYVLITGLDEVKGWTPYQGKIWKAGFIRPSPPGSYKASMVFVNGKRMNWARYPNEDGNMLNTEDMFKVIVHKINEDSGKAVIIDRLPVAADNSWAGAYFVGVADKGNWFTANKGRVASSKGESLVVNDISWNWGNLRNTGFSGEGFGYLIGSMEALDAETEWHLQNDTLYLFPPAGTDMSDDLIEARARTFGLDLTGRAGISVTGIHFKAAAINMDSSINCSLEECSFRYAGSFTSYFTNAWGDYKNGDGGIYVSGNNNLIRDCYIGRTWSHGVSLWGNNNTIENCIVENVNWMAERLAAVWCPGDFNKILRNTIRYGNRDGIELGNSGWIKKYAERAVIKYNHIHDFGYLNPDGGLLYTNHQGGDKPAANTEISFNIWHDFHSEHKYAWGGIYIDNHSSGYRIHHNVIFNVKSGVHMTEHPVPNAHDLYIYHNTIINTDTAVNWFRHIYPHATGTAHDIVVYNNQSDGAMYTGTDVDHNRMDLSDADFVDGPNRNYRLKSTSTSIDAGILLPGINDDAAGMPDLGAYEFNGPDWKAGSSIKVPDFPDEKIVFWSGRINK